MTQDGFGEVEFEMCDHACVDSCLWILCCQKGFQARDYVDGPKRCERMW
jgi:hypothetical protein